MTGLSTFDHSASPPRWSLPREFNAAHDFIERNLRAGRGGKVVYIHDRGQCTYDELAARVNRSANVLKDLGIAQESRVMLCLLDTIEYPAMFLGAIKAGIVPIATNTLLTAKDYEFMLRDSRARALVVAEPLYAVFAPFLERLPHLEHVIVCGDNAHGRLHLGELLERASDRCETADTGPDDMCFWLYTSGSTGTPKGTVHLHSHLVVHAELYARGVLGLTEHDVTYSVPKIFFAYGLGASLAFPLTVGGDRGAHGRAADAGRGVQAADGSPADGVLRGAHAVRGPARRAEPPAARRHAHAHEHLGGRGAVRRGSPTAGASSSAPTSSTASAPPR